MVAATVIPTLARVVIVDDSADCREVLHILLESRGVAAAEAGGLREGLELIRRHRPSVIVFDDDTLAKNEHRLREEFEAATQSSDSALVVLGDVPRSNGESSETEPSHIEVIAKPYHYEPLIRTIERLLARKSPLSR